MQRPGSSRRMHWAIFGAAVLLLNVVELTSRAQQAPAVAAPVRVVDYNWDVRPILSEYCFRCHGPDEKARRANLRLDQADSAYAALAGRVERHAVIPGKPDESEMIRRVTHQTPALRMPPSVTNKVLSAEQIETLRQWIAQGAQYKPHWAYIPPAKPAVPQVKPASRGLDRHRPVRRQPAGAGRPGAFAAGGQGNADQPRQPVADRAAADAGGGGRVPEGHERRPPTRRWWIACWPRRPTASGWPATGWTSPATRRATASWTTGTTGCSGPTATG